MNTGNRNDWKSFIGVDSKSAPPVGRIIKRTGEIRKYDRRKIADAINKAITAATGKGNSKLSEKLTDSVEKEIVLFMKSRHPNSVPAVEEIQDIVESVLIKSGEVETAKAYILYRAKHEAIRDAKSLWLISTQPWTDILCSQTGE